NHLTGKSTEVIALLGQARPGRLPSSPDKNLRSGVAKASFV
ncbi:MAG: hypothetical protein ACI93T_000383, partial [Porticoccaceae bacterium]